MFSLRRLKSFFQPEENTDLIRQVYVFNRYPDGVKPQAFADNAIKTSKYTFWNFLPKNLFEQFKRIANFYFLCVVVIMLCIETPIGPGTTMMPLIIVVAISLCKQGYEDYQRHRADNEVNRRLVNVIRHGTLQQTESKNIKVGDVVKLECEEEFPCDMILLSSSDEEGNCFVTTANLDGETNLKILTCPDETKNMLTVHELYGLDASIECEPPNVDLYRFQGRIVFATDTSLDNISAMKSLGSANLLLRGATLKNTKFVYGVPVYTGKDTKMALNQAQAQYKLPSIEWKMNMYILFFCFVVVALATMLTIIEFFWEVECDKLALYRKGVTFSHSIGGFLNDFFSFIVLFNYVIPISLYVTVEAVKFISSYFIKWDLEMYHAETDTPAKANTSDLNEELGQIEYVFSDKTGTLTENELIFRKCSIAGHKYSSAEGVLVGETNAIAVDLANENVKDFLIAMSLCHSVFTTEQQGNLTYEASSPDERALVEAAAQYGVRFMFASRNSRKLKVEGRLDRYEFLHVLPFDNTRKRMSIILRDPAGKILLFCKGAESSVLEICDSGCVDVTRQHVDDYAAEGLRTLVFAMREITPEDYELIDRLMVDYQNAISDRDAKELSTFSAIESRLCCVGATGVEDRLQDGVFETISALKEGGVKLWVLTGDKMETAVNISQSCNHFTSTMKLHFLTARRDGESCRETLESLLRLLDGTSRERSQTYGLVVDGTSLSTCFETCADLFLRTSLLCTAVLCCRLSPLQKAKVVRMVKEDKSGPVTLAIGDGANDVSMILEANVGVGIFGKEGGQAVRACDFAIARFRFLRNLMFVHGHYFYRRIATVVFYFFYKNVVFVGPAICFLFMNGYSPQTIYSELQLIGFNLIFSALPIVSYGLFEQHLPPTLLYEKPALYKESANSNLLSLKYFVSWMSLAVWNCFVIFIFTFALFYDAGGFNKKQFVGGLWCYGTVAYTSVIVVINITIALKTRYWVWFTHLTIWGTLISYIVFSYIYALSINPSMMWFHESNNPSFVFTFLFSSPIIYMTLIIVTILCILPPVLVMLLQHHVYPEEVDKFRLVDWSEVQAVRDTQPCCGYQFSSIPQYLGFEQSSAVSGYMESRNASREQEEEARDLTDQRLREPCYGSIEENGGKV